MDVSERYSCVEGGCDEAVAERVGGDLLVDSGVFGEASHHPGCLVPVHSLPIAGSEDGSFGSFADGEIDGAGGTRRHGDDDGLAAFATDPQRVMPSLEADITDIGAQGFRDAESVQCE